MPGTLTRRPLPALAALVALLLLTSLVWWRVLHRGGSSNAAACPTPTTSVAPASSLPAPAQVTVQLLNSTTRGGIAARARTRLIDAGFQSPREATNDRSRVRVRGVAEIRFGPAGAKGAKLLSFYFPGAALVPTPSKVATVIVSLGARYRAVATPQTVAAALLKQHLTTVSPSPAPSASTC